MAQDYMHEYSKQQALTGTSDVLSTDVFDFGSAVKLFSGENQGLKLAVDVTASGGTTPTFRARFVGADNAALTTNPIILADTGTSAAIVAADVPVLYRLSVQEQQTAKRYYGVIFTQGGTSPTATANAALVREAASNLVK